jgi:hypothetical protein
LKYHDYQLRGYSVADFGATIKLDLMHNYAGQPLRESAISFFGVALYHFTHTGGAIITDIEEVPVADQLDSIADDLATWNKWYGVSGWRDTLDNYKAYVATEHLRAWTIDSAIGFAGLVIARKWPEQSPTRKFLLPANPGVVAVNSRVDTGALSTK